MKHPYYQESIDELNQAFARFVAENPAASETNKIEDTDPDVQDLLRGFAFLTSDLRARVDIQNNDLYQIYAQYLLSGLFWAKPVSTLIRIHLNDLPSQEDGKELAKDELPIGTSLAHDDAKTPLGDDIRFALPYPYTLSPFVVQKVTGEQSNNKDSYIKLLLDKLGERNPKALRLHLTGHYLDSVNIYALLLHNIQSVLIEGKETEETFELPQEAIVPYALDGSEPLFSQSTFDIEALGLLLEYALLPSKLLAVCLDLEFQNPPKDFFKNNLTFEVTFNFQRNEKAPFPQYHEEALEGIVCNAPAATNLSAKQSVPFQYQGESVSVPLSVAGSNGDTFLHKVEAVFGVAESERRRFYDYNDYTVHGNLPALTYVSKVAIGNENTPLLSLELAFGPSEKVFPKESIVATVLCTNGNRARNAPLKGWRISNGPFSGKTGELFESPSSYVPILTPKEAREAVMYELAVSRFTLSKIEELRALLRYIHLLAGQAKNDRLERGLLALKEVEVKESNALKGTQVVFGQEVVLSVDIKGFDSVGEVVLLGQILARLYESYSPMNCFTELTIYDFQSKENPLFVFPKLLGGHYLTHGNIHHQPKI